MIIINFICPLCNACFTKSFEHVPDQAALIKICPHCKSEIGLTPEKVMEAASAHIVNTAEVKRLAEKF